MEDDAEYLEQLRRVTEESIRHYEQVEIPRILSQQPASQAGSSRYFGQSNVLDTRIPEVSPQEEPKEKKPKCNVEWEDMEWEDDFETAIQMHMDQGDTKIPASTSAGLDGTLTTLELDDSAPGFHRDAGRTWVFPTDFPERRYQFDICQTAIFNDTLVCLPTGLGKTFIAAVVMYNMYRWYPQGCVIFLAPTRPLVNQQVAACRNVAGLPEEHTAELTGSINPALRSELWRSRRVFFMTPQTLANDLGTGIADAMRIRCVVLDEAHRARGGHAYCQLLKAIRARNKHFRLLALSATPGANVAVVNEVLLELGVSRLEARAEDSAELAEFTHTRAIEAIVLPLGFELKAYKDRIYNVVDEFSRKLRQMRLIQSGNLTKFGVLKASQAYRTRQGPKDSAVESEFAVTLALCQAAELLCHHGLRAFYANLTAVLSDPSRNRISVRLRSSAALTALLNDVREQIGDELAPQTQSAPYKCTHPKMQRLVQLVVAHLQGCHDAEHSSRVIVFCQFRDVVTEIRHALEEHRPLVRPTHLIGQANASAANRGQNQKEQRRVLSSFNEGVFNVMIATCVGEEGLDIAEVDLIVCYEPHASPIRLVQRMGRTGRKRNGRVVMLITEGREQQKYAQSVAQGGTVSKQLLRPENFRQALATVGANMVPQGVFPTAMRMTMNPRVTTANQEQDAGKTSKPSTNKKTGAVKASKGNQDLRTMLAKKSAAKESVYADRESMLAIGRPHQRFCPREFLHASAADDRRGWEEPAEGVDLGRWIEWQRLEQDATVARHSALTRDLVRLLQYSGPARPELVALDVSKGTRSPETMAVRESPSRRQAAEKPASHGSGWRQLASQQGTRTVLVSEQGADNVLASQQGANKVLTSPQGNNKVLGWQTGQTKIGSQQHTVKSSQSAENRIAAKAERGKATSADRKRRHKCANCRTLEVKTTTPRKLQLRPMPLSVDFSPGSFTARGILTALLKLVRSPKPPGKSRGSGFDEAENIVPVTNAIGFEEWDDATANFDQSERAELAANDEATTNFARKTHVPENTNPSSTSIPKKTETVSETREETEPRTSTSTEVAHELSQSRSEPCQVDQSHFKHQTSDRSESWMTASVPRKADQLERETPKTDKSRLSTVPSGREPSASCQPMFASPKSDAAVKLNQTQLAPSQFDQLPFVSPPPKPNHSRLAAFKPGKLQLVPPKTVRSGREPPNHNESLLAHRGLNQAQLVPPPKADQLRLAATTSQVAAFKPSQTRPAAPRQTDQSLREPSKPLLSPGQSSDLFEPWELDVAAIDRACATRDETMLTVSALLAELATRHPYECDGHEAEERVDETARLDPKVDLDQAIDASKFDTSYLNGGAEFDGSDVDRNRTIESDSDLGLNQALNSKINQDNVGRKCYDELRSQGRSDSPKLDSKKNSKESLKLNRNLSCNDRNASRSLPQSSTSNLDKRLELQESSALKSPEPRDSPELDLSDLLEAFNNPVVASPVKDEGRPRLKLSRAYQQSTPKARRRQDDLESPSPPLPLRRPSFRGARLGRIDEHSPIKPTKCFDERFGSPLRRPNPIDESFSSPLRNPKPVDDRFVNPLRRPRPIDDSFSSPLRHPKPVDERGSPRMCAKFADDSPRLEASTASSAPLSLDSSDAEFASPLGAGIRRRRHRTKERRQIAGRRRKCRFVESEAESEGRDSSDGENTSGLDAYDSSFVDDVSPAIGGGASQYLCAPSPLRPPKGAAQWGADHAASYLEDSFVVQEADESNVVATQLSPLSLAERKLARRKRRRRNGASSSDDEAAGVGPGGKRRRRRIKSPSPEESPPPAVAATNEKQREFTRILQDFDWTQDFSLPHR